MVKNILRHGDLKNILPTAAIRMGDGHVVHRCGDREVEVPVDSRSIAHWFYVMDTEAFKFVLGTDFSRALPGSIPHPASTLRPPSGPW